MHAAELIDELVAAVRSKPGYRTIDPALIRWIGERELKKRHSLKEAVKQTRSKLHQVAGAYSGAQVDYQVWSRRLAELPGDLQSADLRAQCRLWMTQHASTHERLPLLESFFPEVLASIAPIHSILDFGCGLNALALPWMPLALGFTYYGYDVFEDMVAFINQFLAHTSIAGEMLLHNLAQGLPSGQVNGQLAMLLKAIPCLEQLDKSIVKSLLNEINVPHALVSFPVHSLGGRSKGMPDYYERHFLELVEGTPWIIERFEFSTELAFLMHKKG